MYQSIPSLTTPPPPSLATPRDSHILVAAGLGYLLLCLARGSAQGRILNQNKNLIILGKARCLLCHLNKGVAALFICLYMLEVSNVA